MTETPEAEPAPPRLDADVLQQLRDAEKQWRELRALHENKHAQTELRRSVRFGQNPLSQGVETAVLNTIRDTFDDIVRETWARSAVRFQDARSAALARLQQPIPGFDAKDA